MAEKRDNLKNLLTVVFATKNKQLSENELAWLLERRDMQNFADKFILDFTKKANKLLTNNIKNREDDLKSTVLSDSNIITPVINIQAVAEDRGIDFIDEMVEPASPVNEVQELLQFQEHEVMIHSVPEGAEQDDKHENIVEIAPIIAPDLEIQCEIVNESTISVPIESQILKPGQIPLQSVTPVFPPEEILMPRVNFSFSNARVGTTYLSKIEYSSHTGEKIEIQEVIFSEDVGITYNPETQELAGIPSIDGDYRLDIKWFGDAKVIYSTEATIIINPDPRSLWKIIDPPTDDQYFKTNTDHQIIKHDDVRVVAASRRGRSHEHVGSFRDDDFFISHDQDSGWVIMIVADGAGSAKNSRRGSEVASKIAGEYLSKQMKSELGQTLKALIHDWQPESQKLVGPHFSGLYQKAAKLAVNAIESEAILTEQSIKSYSTTLLITISIRCADELFAAAFWMGDGAIAAYGPVGKVRLLGAPDSGEYAGQTRFLDNDAINDSGFNSRIIIGKWAEISHLILMTDGISDPYFETDNSLLSADRWDVLVNDIQPSLHSDEAAEKLVDWLSFFSPGNHDDRTIALSW